MNQREMAIAKREQDEANANIAYEAFRSDAIERVAECLMANGDLVDLINTLDLEFDSLESLSNIQINDIVICGVRGWR